MKIMKRALAIALFLCMLSVSALAALENISAYDLTYYKSGSVKDISISYYFNWDSVDKVRLVLQSEYMEKKDLSSAGTYAEKYVDFDQVLADDAVNGTFGIIAYSGEEAVEYKETDKYTFTLPEGAIPLDTDATYYVYQWHCWGYRTEYYYPDNLVMAIRIQNGRVGFTPVNYSGGNGNAGFNENGFVEAEGDEPPAKEDPEQLPKTGDAANIALWIGMMAAAAAALIFAKKREFN